MLQRDGLRPLRAAGERPACLRRRQRDPADPYDIPVSLAKRLSSYGDSIKLSTAQQATYKQATKMADEHGPCCCHCWRWTAFEGQAKFLIAHRAYGAERIAKVWDLEDGCGGA